MKDRLHVFTMWLLLAAVFASVRMSGQELPSVYILATGGTIAGVGGTSTAGSYKPSRIGVEQLIEAVPEVNTVARVRGEQVFNVSSQDMDSSHWLVLSKKVNEILAMPGATPRGGHPVGQQEIHEHEALGGGSGRRLYCRLTSLSRSLQTILRINLDGTLPKAF